VDERQYARDPSVPRPPGGETTDRPDDEVTVERTSTLRFAGFAVPAIARPSPATWAAARRYLGRAVRIILAFAAAWAVVVVLLIVLYRWVDPPASTLMLAQRLTGTEIRQRWVPLSRTSPYLHQAVIVSEDGRFCRHWGVDWGELAEAMDRALDGSPRGGSTISMQVVKNLFLWPSKSYIRKAIEIPLTFMVELAWPKARILEIYLNIAEWGPGVFGAEAAARHHFRKSALLIGPREAALLAVSLPNPFERRAGAPGPGTQRLAENLLFRMRAAPGSVSCVRSGRMAVSGRLDGG
jgi:monofunctional glycosyltransferase